IFCYSLTYNSQSITAAALFISFYFIVRERHSGRGGKNALFWGGFLAALGFTIDPIPGGVFLALFLVYLFLRRAGWARILCYLLGSLVPILIYFFLKTSINDSNLDPFGTWFLKRGLIRHSTIGGYLRYALQSFLGIRGLFSYSPVLLFGLAGLIRLLRRPVHPYRLEAFIAAAFLLLSSFLTLLVTSTYGGWCYGIRYFVPLIPILFFFAAFAFESAGRPLKIIFILCLVVSLAVSAIGVAKPGTDCSRGKFTLINNIRFLRSRSGPELLRDYLPILRLIGRG
ncbi:MAG: hypothetical protein U9N73_01340, partial [Candidatus Auribacterota bacterium]|nr:hypothetical protein [Candidatus Auribacterota bacterium]